MLPTCCTCNGTKSSLAACEHLPPGLSCTGSASWPARAQMLPDPATVLGIQEPRSEGWGACGARQMHGYGCTGVRVGPGWLEGCVCVCLCVRWMHGQTHGHAVVRCKAQSPFLGTRMNDEQACERGSHMFCTKAVVIVSSIHGHCLSDAAKTLDDQGIATPVANGQLAMLCYCLHMLCYCLHMLHAWATHPHAAQVCAYDAVIKISAST